MKYKQLRSAIKCLSNQEKRDAFDNGMYVSHLTANKHANVGKLVGKK